MSGICYHRWDCEGICVYCKRNESLVALDTPDPRDARIATLEAELREARARADDRDATHEAYRGVILGANAQQAKLDAAEAEAAGLRAEAEHQAMLASDALAMADMEIGALSAQLAERDAVLGECAAMLEACIGTDDEHLGLFTLGYTATSEPRTAEEHDAYTVAEKIELAGDDLAQRVKAVRG